MPQQMRLFLHMITRSLGAKSWGARCFRRMYWARKQVELLYAFSVEKRRDKLKLSRLGLQHQFMIGVNCGAGELAKASLLPAARFFFAAPPRGRYIVGRLL